MSRQYWALAGFVLLEAVALRPAMVVLMRAARLTFFPNDVMFNVAALLLAAIVAYGVGYALLVKWRARSQVRLATALAVVLVSLVSSYWLSVVMLRLMFH